MLASKMAEIGALVYLTHAGPSPTLKVHMGDSDLPFAPNPPADYETIFALRNITTAKPLPKEYIDFLRRANGGEGFLGENFAILWRAEELIEFNRDYQAPELAPQLFLIGSNGGGEAYAFDQGLSSSTVFIVPFIGMEYASIRQIAESFSSFVVSVSV